MKRAFTLVILVAVLCVFSCCTAPPKEYILTEQLLARADLTDEDLPLFEQVLARANNSKSAEQLVSRCYPLSLMRTPGTEVNAGAALKSAMLITQAELEKWFSVEAIRKTDDTHYYTVYKIHEGGWLYVFTQIRMGQGEPKLPFAIVTHAVYTQKNADKSALQKIAAGASASAVMAADPATALILENGINATQSQGRAPYSLHWCDNEVYIFTYDESGETVTGVEHYPDGRVPSSVDGWYFDYNLLPVDRQ